MGWRDFRRKSSPTSTAISPGASVHAKTARTWPAVTASTSSASSGPSAAPRVSALRWKPNALPRTSGATASASIASRGLPRNALPPRSTRISPSATGQFAASASTGLAAFEIA